MKKALAYSILAVITLCLGMIVLADLPGLQTNGTQTNFISTVATGTQPYACTSTTKNTNLNADSLDGHDTAYFQTALGAGLVPATYLQSVPADLGDADIGIDLSNTNAGNVTTLTIDGGMTAKDITFSNGETISNDVDGTIYLRGISKLDPRLNTAIYNTDGTETMTAALSGAMVVATKSDGTTTVTIPDPTADTVGVMYYLMQTEDQNLVVTAETLDSNSIVCDGVATSDAVTISTASHKIGAGMFVLGIQTGAATYKWFVGGLNPDSPLTPEAAD